MSADPVSAFDEWYGHGNVPREMVRDIDLWLKNLPDEELKRKRDDADILFCRLGITFVVYGREGGTEQLIPFDTIPRVFSANEWRRLEEGSIQRVRALNMFLHDIYHGRDILRAGVVPSDLVLVNDFYMPQMVNFDPPGGIYTHVAGIDLVRTGESEFCVLEDNLRSPSGVSYMLENREVTMRLFPDLFAQFPIAPVNHYPSELLRNLRAVAPGGIDDPTVVVLTPGFYNSAYFEHAFLADQLGIELVEGRDLFVRDGLVHMRTTDGPQKVDVIYRRIGDDFLDPLAFRADSTLGVSGLLSVYRSGKVAIANAMGPGLLTTKRSIPMCLPSSNSIWMRSPSFRMFRPSFCAVMRI